MIHSIVILPLLGFLIACTLSFFKRNAFIDRLAEVVTCTFIVLAAFFSFYIFIVNIGSPSVVSLKLFTWIETGSLSEYFEVVYPHLNRLNYNINKNFGLEEKTNNMRQDLLVKYQ